VAVIELHLAALEHLGFPEGPEGPSTFSLRNGADVLRRSFRDVQLHTFRDRQAFAGAEALVAAYRTTGRFRAASRRAEIGEANLVRAAESVASEWAGRQGGRLISPIVMGAFFCTGPRPGSHPRPGKP
jgi:hypothetical protein